MNDLLEEEIDIIDAFNYEMNLYGHKGFYSFTNFVDNGYYIYKDDGHWIVCFSEKGKVIKTKKYTNIYNLCLDILLKMNIETLPFQQRDWQMPRGTEVIITKNTDCPVDEIRKGVIIRSRVEMGEHGHSERIYDILGDDELLYTGLYGLKLYSDITFRTMEDYIKDSEKEIKDNKDTIEYLSEYNLSLSQNLLEVMGMMDTSLNNCKGIR